MFTLRPCEAGCGRPAISGSDLCAVHIADRNRAVSHVMTLIRQGNTAENINASGLDFEEEDFSGCSFSGCTFKKAKFTSCTFTKTFMRMVFFDSVDFTNCKFRGCDMRYISFAGSRFLNVVFKEMREKGYENGKQKDRIWECELENCNFTGAMISDCAFNDASLKYSRFINADFSHSVFNNCDVKMALFIESRLEGLTFKTSNENQAVYELID